MKTRFIILFCMLLGPWTVLAHRPDYRYTRYSIRDGLPNNHVRWITQDKTGFLWIATWDGLVRFDGAEFKVYQHNPNDPTTVSFFDIIKVCVDSSNRVWIFAGGILCRYMQRYDHFVTYGQEKFQPYDSVGGRKYFTDIMIGPDGNLLAVAVEGFYRYNAEKDQFSKLSGMESLIRIHQASFSAFDAQGDYWYLQTNFSRKYGKVFTGKYDPEGVFLVRDSFPCEQETFMRLFNNETVHFKVHRNAEQVWLTTNHGLLILENDTFKLCEGQLPQTSLPEGEVLIWSQPGSGLLLYDPEEKSPDTLFEPKSIETIIAFYQDHQDNIWFNDMSNPTERYALTMANSTGDFFTHYMPEASGGASYAFFGLLKDREGNIWAGGRPNDYLLKIEPGGNTVKIPVPFSPANTTSYPRQISIDGSGNLWIAFFYDFLFRMDPKDGSFTDFSFIDQRNAGSSSRIIYRTITPLENGMFATGGGGRIIIFEPVSRESISLQIPGNLDLFCIYPTSDGTLWVGLSGRLMKTDYGLNDPEVIEIIDPRYNVEDIVAGDSADLWLALLGGGLCHFDISTRKTEFYTTFHGLAHNTVYSVRKDNGGHLWMSHNLGISSFNPATRSFINYGEEDGLNIREFDSEAAWQTDDGKLLFGGIGGIVEFHSDNVRKFRKDSPSGLIISNLRVSNRDIILDRSTYDTEHFSLPKGTDNFQISFVRPDFRYGHEMKYRYRLDQDQEMWTITDSKHRMVNYTSLQPGRYKFEVESTGLNGEWKYHTEVTIEIPAFFYQTNLFKILAGIFVLGILFLLFYFILMHARMVERKKQEHLKLESLRGQMNPHFIFNSLNSINYFISRNDRLNANQFISDFSRLIRAIMNNSSQEYISLDSEIEAIREYLSLEHLRFSDKFDYEIKVDDAIDTGSTEVTPSMVQPFIENAIWHGMRYLDHRKGFLSVRFVLENGSLVSYVEDDGIGRKLSAQRKSDEQRRRRSRGIALVEERLKIINALLGEQYALLIRDLYGDQKESGTAVRLEIPFKRT